MIKKWVGTKIHEQWVDTHSVRPHMNCTGDRVYLNCCAGLIEYRPKTTQELSRFRDNWVNRFNIIMEAQNRGADMTASFYKFYVELLSSGLKLKYKGNLRTRIRMKRWSLFL